MQSRRNFIGSIVAFGVVECLRAEAVGSPDRYAVRQSEIDLVSAVAYSKYMSGDSDGRSDLKALKELESSFDRMVSEIRHTVVTGDRPAVWHVYNMGTIVKTREACFSIDLKHRKGVQLAPLLDFALITHNHGDHYDEKFYRKMDGARKLVISNFKDNYGIPKWENGGYTRVEKEFHVKDVTIRTSLTDHNNYLVDFTTVFEIAVGGFTIYHTGDCSNVAKLNPRYGAPGLWIVHPFCDMNVEDGFRKFRPSMTVLGHLNELGHSKWRWSYQEGLSAKSKIEALGGSAVVPLWGERI